MLSAIDHAIFFFLNHTLANPVLDTIIRIFIGTPVKLILVVSGVALLVAGRKYQKITGLALLSSYTVAAVVYKALKFVIQRPRPFHILEDVRLLLGPNGGFSCPSGHTTTAFCIATVLAIRYPRIRYLSFTAAVLVALSRPYLGVHYPSDILAGAVLGILVAYTVTKTAGRLEKVC